MEENILIKLLSLVQDSTMKVQTLKGYLNYKRLMKLIMYTFILLTARQQFKETIIMVGTILTVI